MVAPARVHVLPGSTAPTTAPWVTFHTLSMPLRRRRASTRKRLHGFAFGETQITDWRRCRGDLPGIRRRAVCRRPVALVNGQRAKTPPALSNTAPLTHAASALTTGSAYASVLPLPVGAATHRSCAVLSPPPECSHTTAWTGNSSL